MKKIYILTALILFTFSSNLLTAQTVWNGPVTTFTKANNVDWMVEENQDRLTENVWITRANNSGLFNIVLEENAGATGIPGNPAPSDTEWAYGTTAGFDTLVYQPLGELIGENFNMIVDGQNLVLHLITDDIFIDLVFTSWTSGANGGGFSYERSTDATTNTIDLEARQVKLFPNPSTDFIQISGLNLIENYNIYNVQGITCQTGKIANQEQIDIQHLTNGLYFLEFENGDVVRFFKD